MSSPAREPDQTAGQKAVSDEQNNGAANEQYIGAAARQMIDARFRVAATNPVEICGDVQRHNQLTYPNTAPVIEFIDKLTELKRSSAFAFVLDALRAKLLTALAQCQETQLLELLERTFPFVTEPQLRDIVVAVLTALPTVPRKYLAALAVGQVRQKHTFL
jgi:hypothetical protein